MIKIITIATGAIASGAIAIIGTLLILVYK
jgi:hypothetical protein